MRESYITVCMNMKPYFVKREEIVEDASQKSRFHANLFGIGGIEKFH